MYCKYCGKEMKDTAAFCPACGKTTGNAGQKPEKQNEFQNTYQPGRRGGDGIINMGGSQAVDLYALISMLVSFVTIILSVTFICLFETDIDLHMGLFVVSLLFAVCAIVFGTMAKRRNGISPMARAGRIIGIICLVVVPLVFVMDIVSAWLLYEAVMTAYS